MKPPNARRRSSKTSGLLAKQVHAYLVAETGDALMERDLQTREVWSDWFVLRVTNRKGWLHRDHRSPIARLASTPATRQMEMEVVPQAGTVLLSDLPVIMRLGDVVKLMKGGSDAAIGAVRGNAGR